MKPDIEPVLSSNGRDRYEVEIDPERGTALRCPCKAWANRQRCRHATFAEQQWRMKRSIPDPNDCPGRCGCEIGRVWLMCVCPECINRDGVPTWDRRKNKWTRVKISTNPNAPSLRRTSTADDAAPPVG